VENGLYKEVLMTNTKTITTTHPTEVELADYLSKTLSGADREVVENHIAGCNECLEKVVSAHESVKGFKKRKVNFMKKMNIYLILAVISFLLSFVVPTYFMQFLVATLLLGIKWIVDAKSTKMLIMIYEAWKKGGEKEASRIISTLDSKPKNRL
jgi:hypothetical protein